MEGPLIEREDRKEGSQVFFLEVISTVGTVYSLCLQDIVRDGEQMKIWMCSSEAGLTWELRVTSMLIGI